MTKSSILLSFETLNAEGVCACVVDAKEQTVFASKSFCTLLGYRPEALRALPLERFVILCDEKNGKNSDIEQGATLIRRDGSTLKAHALPGLPVALAPGGTGTLHCFADISRHQAMLQDQQAIVNNLSLGIIFTRTGIVQRANRHAEEMLGHTAGGLIGKSISELLASTENYQTLSQNIAPTIARGNAFEGEVELRRADGSAFPCRFRSQAILPNDPTQGAVWICEDRSLINATEAALRMTREELEAVVDNAMIGMIMVEDRRIVWCNSKFEAMLGYDKNETVGKDTQMFYESRRDWTAFGENIKQLDDGTVRTWEQILRRKDGSLFWCYMSGKALFNNGELNKRTLWLLEDVTWRKEAEQTLIDAKTLAEEATRTKSIFLANMSHGIRTPMNAVICLSDLLLRTDLVAEQRDYAEKINEAGTALLGVIDDILDFSKIEAGKIELRQTRFSLDAVLDHIATLLGRKAHEKGIDLAFDTSAFLPRALVGDPQRLGQILTNLIGNAIKFTERGQVIVRARLIELSEAQATVRFEVRDTGIGIHLKRLSYLFEPFTEHESSNDSQPGGTGLGLSICKHLVELMGGSIKVSSKLGRGSTFSFDLQFGRDASAEDAAQSLPGYLQGMRVLVVDPNPVSRDIRIRSLSTLGFRVDAADSGAEALGAITRCEATDPCRIAFVDQKLPDIDGIEACRQLKNAVAANAVPDVVLFISAGNANLKSRAKEAGVDALLVKPISHSALEDTLSRLFNAKQRNPVTRQQAPQSAFERVDGLHVLLVEDNDVNRQVAQALLNRAGITADIASSGFEALERLDREGQRYDAVLMDVRMPKMDGKETTRRLRADARWQNLPVIALTANAVADNRAQCLDIGMNDYITKPINPNVLYETLDRWCNQKDIQTAAGDTWARFVAPEHPGQKVPGLNTACGLQFVGGRLDKYQRRLELFVQHPVSPPEVLGPLIERGDRQEAAHMARELAGAALQVGAEPLAEAAQRLEQALTEARQPAELRELCARVADEQAYLRWAWMQATTPSTEGR